LTTEDPPEGFPVHAVFYDLKQFLPAVDGVIHIGAHRGEELPLYRQAKLRRKLLVEPIPQFAEALRKEASVEVVERVVTTLPDATVPFFITTRSTGSSRLTPLQHKVFEAISVRTITLDRLMRDYSADGERYLLVVDTEGSELDVLRSGEAWFDRFPVLIVELNTEYRFAYMALRDAIVSWLFERGYRLEREYQHVGQETITDGVFVRATTDAIDAATA
jgi:FkbM family methyltransferase